MTKHGLSLLERLMSRTDTSGECWIWLGFRDRDGYGLFSGQNRATTRAHRQMYALEHGLELDDPNFKGKPLDHLCRNRACIRPSHLELVTQKVNMERGEKATRTHCNKGHEFTEENTYRKPNGTRSCRACHNQNEKTPEARARRAAAARQYRARKVAGANS